LWAVTCLVVVIATACGSQGVTEDTGSPTTGPTTTSASTTTPTPVSRAPAGVSEITIDRFRYTEITVPPGAQVTVINKDSGEHTVTSDTPGVFDVHVGGNAQATFTAPNAPGKYTYYCTYHPSMHGTLVVQ